MKIILSRKGFDKENGGMASPILPDGTLLSMPIPTGASETFPTYSQLKYDGKTYLNILQELKPSFTDAHCHLDPDIREECIARPIGWVPLFGQCHIAQIHLMNNLIKDGDVFLFFGWFRQTELNDTGKLCFVKDAPDIHAIYGYMQIGKIISEKAKIQQAYAWHPHAHSSLMAYKNNCLYAASKIFSLNEDLPGCGTLSLSEHSILTQSGFPQRTRWKEHDFFKGMTYHSDKSSCDGYFQSASRGQEFVIAANVEAIDWLKEIVT